MPHSPFRLTPSHKALFILLRSGLYETPPDDLSPFPLGASAWREVYRMSVRQTVVGIVFSGLQRLPDDLLPPDDLLVRWVAQVDRIERRNRHMNEALRRLLDLMHGDGLHPVLLKGQGMAAFYERPLLRECGDIDLYFPSPDEERRAAQLVRAAGCTPRRHPDGSNVYTWMGVDVEHHTRLFDLYRPALQPYLAALEREHGYAEVAIPPTVVVPSPLLNLVMANAHLLKHMMGHGAGLRQFCDLARAYRRLGGNYPPEQLEAVHRRTGLFGWSVCLHTFLMEHLGVDHFELPYFDTDAATSPCLLRIIFDGGNFGQYGATKGKAAQAPRRRKMNTLLAYWKRRAFSMRYARKEAFWTMVRLIKGNIT